MFCRIFAIIITFLVSFGLFLVDGLTGTFPRNDELIEFWPMNQTPPSGSEFGRGLFMLNQDFLRPVQGPFSNQALALNRTGEFFRMDSSGMDFPDFVETFTFAFYNRYHRLVLD